MDTFDQNDEGSHPPLQGFDNLALLDCTDCSISSWQTQVRRLRFLPKLNELVLNDNQIQFVVPADNEPQQVEFSSMELLQLAGNDIKAWTDIDAIASFSSLTALRFRNNPITSVIGGGEARSTLIARLPNITELNSSGITEKERVESERRYVASVARELLTLSQGEGKETNHPQSSQNEDDTDKHSEKIRQKIVSLHPRFDELMNKHKDSMLSIQSSANGNTRNNIANDAINVTVRSMAASSCAMEPMRKRLPGTLKVGRLKILCSRAFGIDVDLMTLHFKAEVSDFWKKEY